MMNKKALSIIGVSCLGQCYLRVQCLGETQQRLV